MSVKFMVKYVKVHGSMEPLLAAVLICLISCTNLSYASEDNTPTGIDKARHGSKDEALIPVKPCEIEQILIPKGSASLGSDDKEKEYGYSIGGAGARMGRWFDSEVERRVFVDAFYIDKYPVTQGQYYEFIKETGHGHPFISESDYQRQGFLVHPYSSVLPYLWTTKERGEDKEGAGRKWERGEAPYKQVR
jgi:formylglycine-generating enzyme required for sulfatase activity